MPGLTDVAPSKSVVTVNGTDVSVFGVSAAGIAVLLERFPEFKRLVTGKSLDLAPERIAKLVPESIEAVIAAGCGQPGDKDAEAAAARLPLQSQMDLLEKIVDLTMPKGVGPFVEAFQRLAGGIGGDLINTADTK